MPENRRRHPRVRAQGIVAHLRGPTGRYPCHVENISVGGLFVRTDRVLDVGTQLEVDLVRPGWKKSMTFFVRVTSRIDPLAGRFARITPGMGVQFFGKMDEEHRERLLQLLRELGAPEPEPEAIAFGPGELELPPADADDAVALETEVPLWQQVSMVEEANEAPPGRTGPVRTAAPEQAPRAPAPPAPLPRPAPAQAIAHPARPRPAPPPPPPPPRAPVVQSAPAPGTATPEARLMLQIRGLLLELSNAQQLLTQRDLEIGQLKAELEVVHAQLDAIQRK